MDGENIFAQSAELLSCQLFILEREEGAGVVKAGDRIRLKSQFTNKYLAPRPGANLYVWELRRPRENVRMCTPAVTCAAGFLLPIRTLGCSLSLFGVHLHVHLYSV